MSASTPEVANTDADRECLKFSVTRLGTNGSADVVCSISSQSIHRDRLVPAKARDRDRYAAAVLEKLGEASAIDANKIKDELIAISQRLDAGDKHDATSAVASEGARELPASCVIRPELIIREDLSAITIPKMMQVGGRNSCEWCQFVRSDRDRREAALGEKLTLPNGSDVWLSPTPVSPTPGDVRDFNRWSLASREQWLAGGPAPTTREVLRLVAERIDRYVVLPSEHAKEHGLTLAAWIMMTYVYPALPAVPYVYLAGPPNSGKTRTMDVISRMVFRPLMAGNVSAASIFRTRHAYGGVMLLDEAERMGDSRSPDVAEIQSILLLAYRRDGRVLRMEPSGDTFRTVSFDVYGPTVIGAIRGMPPALASRCITVRLLRASKSDPQTERSLDDSPNEAIAILDALHCWALEYGYQAISTATPSSSLANRDAELWGPLLRIVAHTGDREAVQLLVDHAQQASILSSEDSTPQADPVLLTALYDLRKQGLKPTAGEVLEKAILIDPDVVDGTWSAKGVAGVIKRYDIRTRKTNGRRVFKIEPDAVVAIANRYGFDLDGEDQK